LPDRSAFGGSAGALGIFYLGTIEWGDGEKREAQTLFREFLAAPVGAEIPFWGTYREVAERLVAAP
jgi:hypothetical protein